jgi:hypothetical protein
MVMTAMEKQREYQLRNPTIKISRVRFAELNARVGGLTKELVVERDAFVANVDTRHDHGSPNGSDSFLGFTSAAWTGVEPGAPYEALIDVCGMRPAVTRWRTKAIPFLQEAGELVPPSWCVTSPAVAP